MVQDLLNHNTIDQLKNMAIRKHLNIVPTSGKYKNNPSARRKPAQETTNGFAGPAIQSQVWTSSYIPVVQRKFPFETCCINAALALERSASCGRSPGTAWGGSSSAGPTVVILQMLSKHPNCALKMYKNTCIYINYI